MEVGFRDRLGLAAWFGTLAVVLMPSCSFGWGVLIICEFSEVAMSLRRDASRDDRERWHYSRGYGWGYGKSNLRQPRTLVRWEGQSLELQCDLPTFLRQREDQVVWSRQNKPMQVDKLPKKIHIDGPDLRIDVLAVKHTAVYRCDLELNSHRAPRRTFYIEFRLTVFEKPQSREKPNLLMSVHPLEQLVGETDASQPFYCDVSRRQPSVIQWVKLTDTSLLPAPSADDPTLYSIDYADQLETKYEWRIHTTSWNFPRKSTADEIMSRDLEFNHVTGRDEGLYACVVSHPDIVQIRLVNLSVAGEHATFDLVWPSAQEDDDLYENYSDDTLDSPEASPVQVIVTQSVKDSSDSKTRFSLTSSTITQTSFFSVMTIVIILATFCFLCITFAAVKIIRTERVYPGQKMRVRHKKKPAIQPPKSISLTNLVYVEIGTVKHRPGKNTRNQFSRFLSQILIPVCQPGTYKMKPYNSESFLPNMVLKMPLRCFAKREELPSVEGVKLETAAGQIDPDMENDIDFANDSDIYDLELAFASSNESTRIEVQVHQPPHASSTPCPSRAASVKSLNDMYLPGMTRNMPYQRRALSEPELPYQTESNISDSPENSLYNLFMTQCSSKRPSHGGLEFDQEPVFYSNEAIDKCHYVGDNTADNISQDKFEEPECDHHTPAPLIPHGMDPSDTVTSKEGLHSTLVYQGECEKPNGDISTIDAADSDMSEEEHEPAGNNTMEQDQMFPQGDNPSLHVPPERCPGMVGETHNNTIEQQQCPLGDNHSDHFPPELSPSAVDGTPTESSPSAYDGLSGAGYLCLPKVNVSCIDAPTSGNVIYNHTTIPEHETPNNTNEPGHIICKHADAPENKSLLDVPCIRPQRCRLESCGCEVAADDQSYSDEEKNHPARYSHDNLSLIRDVSGYPCPPTVHAKCNDAHTHRHTVDNHGTIPEHGIPNNAATPGHALCNHTSKPRHRAQRHASWMRPSLCRLDSHGDEEAADDRSYSDESQDHPSACSQDSLALPQDISDTSSDESPLFISPGKVEEGEEEGEEGEVPVIPFSELYPPPSPSQDIYSIGGKQ